MTEKEEEEFEFRLERVTQGGWTTPAVRFHTKEEAQAYIENEVVPRSERFLYRIVRNK